MRTQPRNIALSALRSGYERRPIRLLVGSELVVDMAKGEALALADALVDAAEDDEVTE
ncbi:hypothetical protein M3D00_17260 [Dietzia cinnamea]|uniref:hypothetical protein n=1 Tax=Dietzia cinnamea TaxID=321318 RepID=UPI0021A36042|nr:hypothetical protein [Dietzia cinnamea]MCT2031879.1 hypothetical protein [Dietzia cinnamea]